MNPLSKEKNVHKTSIEKHLKNAIVRINLFF
ncbi:hypothetical protein BH09DEP1_BH09DEP1_2800 [soil metagenome]